MNHLILAAEDTAYLIRRGYRAEAATTFVAQERELSDDDRRVLACASRASTHYKHHIARELEADDVARRVVTVDTASVVATVAAGLRGALLVETEAGLLCDPRWAREGAWPSEGTEEAIALVGAALRRARPKAVRWLVDEAGPDLTPWTDALLGAAGKKKGELVRVDDVVASLDGHPFVASSDPEVLDRAATWCNLVALALEGRDVERVRL